ncbi:hypothetical protein BCR44DRAFT_75388, partial [Catenaria anguillulae PL171]
METPHAILPAEILLSVLGLTSPASRLAATSSAIATLLRGDRAVQHAWVNRIVFSDTTFCDDNGDNDGQRVPSRRLCTFLEPFEKMIDDFRLLKCVDNHPTVPSYWAQYRRQHDEKHDELVKQSIAAVYSFAPLLASAAIQSSHSTPPDDPRAPKGTLQRSVDLVRLCVFFMRIRHLEAFSATLRTISQQPSNRLSVQRCPSCVTDDAELLIGMGLDHNDKHVIANLFLLKALSDLPPLDFIQAMAAMFPPEAIARRTLTRYVHNQQSDATTCATTLHQDPEHLVRVLQWIQNTVFRSQPLPVFASILARHVDNYQAFLHTFLVMDVPNLVALRARNVQVAFFSNTFTFYASRGLGFEVLATCLNRRLLSHEDIGAVIDSACMMEDGERSREWLKVLDEHVTHANLVDLFVLALQRRLERLSDACRASSNKTLAIDCTPLILYMVRRQVDPMLVFARTDSDLPPGLHYCITMFFDCIYSALSSSHWTRPDDLFRFLDHLATAGQGLVDDNEVPELGFTCAALHYLLTNCLGTASTLDPIVDKFTPAQFTLFAALALAFMSLCEQDS